MSQPDNLPPRQPLFAPLRMTRADYRPEVTTPYTKPRVKMPLDRLSLVLLVLVVIVVALVVVWVLHSGGFGTPPPPTPGP
ncbi:MAG TPA: hypothetical protein VID72_12690 [Ktedonobacterales bacterium]